jgi:hypothetical protein
MKKRYSKQGDKNQDHRDVETGSELKDKNEYKWHKERCIEEPGRDGTGREKEEAIR